MNGIRSGAVAASGIAQGLGLVGALGIGAFLWGKDVEKLFEQVVGIWPESGVWFSPEWIAKWGDDPVEQTEDALVDPDNGLVDGLAPVINSTGVHSLVGKSPYQVYAIAASGRAAEYAHSETQIINNYTSKYGVGIAPGSIEEAQIIAEWYTSNSPPPDMLLLGQVAVQVNIRVTCARINLSALKYIQNEDPPAHSDFVNDPLLDWTAYVTIPVDKDGNKKEPHATVFNNTPKRPYNYILKASAGEQQIAAYAYWSPQP